MIGRNAMPGHACRTWAFSLLLAALNGIAPSHSQAAQPELCQGQWYSARLTNYESYPAPNSAECRTYNGCAWVGQFYGLPDRKMPEAWISEHNIVAVHMKDWRWLGLKTLKLRQGRKEIFVQVLDACADSDCDGCCTENLGRQKYLIDMEKYTMRRFGAGDGTVEFQVCQ